MSSTLPGTPYFDFTGAAERLKAVVRKTPLIHHARLSKKYNCNVYLKGEDLQVVRSYKIRGAYNLMSSLSRETLNKGVVCASAGNHALIGNLRRYHFKFTEINKDDQLFGYLV